MYLPVTCDKAILQQLKGNLMHFSVSFDYFATAMIAKTTGVGGLTRMTDNFERMNARWITGFDDIAALAEHALCRGPGNVTMAMGITLAENRLDLLGERLFIEDRGPRDGRLAWGPRIGISVGTERAWRVFVVGHPAVSG